MSPAARGSLAATLLLGAGVLLALGNAPSWCVAIGIAVVAWRVLVLTGRLTKPRRRRGTRFVMGAVTALLVGAVAMRFRTLNGLEAGTALLVVMGALKVVEAQSRRDDAIVIGVALFLLLAAALEGQSLWRAPVYLCFVWLACAAIALVAHRDPLLDTRAALRLAARALAMSLPLAVLCFLCFPRISGQFWALQRGDAATIGLTDEMAPGSVGKLAIEYDPAFRVRFEQAPPPRSALYWRGPVLNSFDGFTWRRDRSHFYPAETLELLGEPVRYRITLEPTHQPWLFALDTVDASPRRDILLSHDRQLSAMNRVDDTTSYSAQSHLAIRSRGTLSNLARRYETRLPPDRNPRTRAQALAMRAHAASDAQYAREVLDWFHGIGLEYTLDPGATGIDSVDTTLFDTHRGFCAHFASAYATMMRAVDIPARVVTGYLGGEWNSVGGYLIVRQSDAHAWTEIWLDGQGWTRVDPTTVVAPERLQRGIFEMLSASLPVGSALLHNNAWFNELGQLWDGASQWWRERVVEFDARTQVDLLEKLGIQSPTWQHLGWALAIGLSAWITWVALALRRSTQRVKPDRVARAWLRATRRLARVAPERAGTEGPLDFARRVASTRPELAAQVQSLAWRYARLRFGPAAGAAEVEALERDVRQLAV